MNISSNIKTYAGTGFHLANTFRCVAIAIGISLALLFVFAFVVTFTPYPEGFISLGVLAILIISNLVGGFLTAKTAQSNGWVNGGVAGAIYMLLLFIVGSFINGFCVTSNTFMMVTFGILSGAVGGIFGINLKPKRR